MSIQTSLLPHKHIRFCDSILGLAGLVRQTLVEPMSIDELYLRVRYVAKEWKSQPSFTNIILALDILFALGQIESVSADRVRLNSDETS